MKKDLNIMTFEQLIMEEYSNALIASAYIDARMAENPHHLKLYRLEANRIACYAEDLLTFYMDHGTVANVDIAGMSHKKMSILDSVLKDHVEKQEAALEEMLRSEYAK